MGIVSCDSAEFIDSFYAVLVNTLVFVAQGILWFMSCVRETEIGDTEGENR